MRLSIERNIPIDALRGFAIFIMVISNSYDYIFDSNPNIIMRLFLSSAAPIFIFLSGYTFQLSVEKNKPNIEFIKRIIQILVIAIVIDIFIWKLYPVQNFDVLYLISFSLIGMRLLKNFSVNIKLLIALLFALGSFVLRIILQYRFQMKELDLGSLDFNTLSNFYGFDFFKRIIIDGWFPVFPWFSIVIMGAIAKQKIDYIKKNSKFFGVLGLILIIITSCLFTFNFKDFYSNRNSYIELFYPVTRLFSMYLLGILGIIFFIITQKSIGVFSKLLFQIVGKYSLFFYFLHSIIIGVFLKTFFTNNLKANHWYGISVLILFWILILIIASLLERYKANLLRNKFIKSLFFLIGIS